MKYSKLLKKLAVGGVLIAVGRFPYCSNYDLLANPLAGVNPCGTLLNCDPTGITNDAGRSMYRNLVASVNQAVNGTLGPQDYCTIPYMCGTQDQVMEPVPFYDQPAP